jgi:putative phosphoribosyl transferase
MSWITSMQTDESAHAVYDAVVPAGQHSLHARIYRPVAPTGWVIVGYSRFYRQFTLSDATFGNAGLATMHLQLQPPETSPNLLESETNTQLTQQLMQATQWLGSRFEARALPIGLFGAYQDAGVALSTAAFLGDDIGAVVSFQGRPDNSMNHLPEITSPTLLLVNQTDTSVLVTNVQARWWLRCTNQLSLVPGRLRLLREKSSFEAVNQLAGNWYIRHLLGRQPLKDFPGQLLRKPVGQEWHGALLQ